MSWGLHITGQVSGFSAAYSQLASHARYYQSLALLLGLHLVWNPRVYGNVRLSSNLSRLQFLYRLAILLSRSSRASALLPGFRLTWAVLSWVETALYSVEVGSVHTYFKLPKQHVSQGIWAKAPAWKPYMRHIRPKPQKTYRPSRILWRIFFLSCLAHGCTFAPWGKLARRLSLKVGVYPDSEFTVLN